MQKSFKILRTYDIFSRVNYTFYQEILDSYPINQDNIEVVPLYAGRCNANFLIKSSQESFVLTIFQPEAKRDEEIEQEIQIFDFLHQKGEKVPQLIETKRGEKFLYHEIFEFPRRIAAFSYLEGKTVYPYQVKNFFEAGRILSDIHFLLKRYPRKKELKFWPQKIGGETTILHFDFARANLLFDDSNDCVGILDFEDAVWGPPVVDLARSLSIFIKDNKTLHESEIMGNFLKGYQVGKNELTDFCYLPSLIADFYYKLCQKEVRK